MGPKLLYRWVNIIHPYSQPSHNPEPTRPESVEIFRYNLPPMIDPKGSSLILKRPTVVIVNLKAHYIR